MGTRYFQAGATTYVCRLCGRLTRETGDGESGVELCAPCYEAEGLKNEHSDGHHLSPVPGCPGCEQEKDKKWLNPLVICERCGEKVRMLWHAQGQECPNCHAFE